MDSKAMQNHIQQILDQAPDGTMIETVEQLWKTYDGDMVAILSKLWDIQDDVQKEKGKWDKIREICDAHDDAMDRMIHTKST